MKTRIDWAEANAACEGLTEKEDSFTREIVTRLAEKWTLWAWPSLRKRTLRAAKKRLKSKEGEGQKPN
jgi:hypothetical protein